MIDYRRIAAALVGGMLLILSTVPLWPYVQLHLADPQVDVFAPGTIATYLSEIFLEVDAVGVWPTVAAWIGIVMLAGVAVSYHSAVRNWYRRIDLPHDPDRPWCPDCETSRWSYQTSDDGRCEECETAVVDEWPLWARVRKRLGQVTILVIGGSVLFGPPLWALYRAATYEGPLYATRTVTMTRVQHYGLLFDIGGALLPWVAVILLILMIPYAPRGI